jgi:hypothetical protein
LAMLPSGLVALRPRSVGPVTCASEELLKLLAADPSGTQNVSKRSPLLKPPRSDDGPCRLTGLLICIKQISNL